MSIKAWIRNEVREWRVKAARDARLTELTEEVVKAVDPRLRAVPGYRRRLRPAVGHAKSVATDVVGRLTRPIELSREAWAKEARLRAFFASPDSMREILEASTELRRYLLSPEARGAERVYAALSMHRREQRRFGHALAGEMLQRDVEQTAVEFADHRVGVTAVTRTSLQRRLRRRVMEEYATRAMQRMLGQRARRDSLTEQQAALRWKLEVYQREQAGLGGLWHDRELLERHVQELEAQLGETEASLDSLRERAGDIDDLLDIVVEVFAEADRITGIDSLELYLDRMNILRGPDSGDAARVDLAEVRLGRRRPRVVQLVYFSPGLVAVDSQTALRRAARALGV